MSEIIKNRIEQLRLQMAKQSLDAYIIYGTDPHLSEYLPGYWQTREYISGFSGSAGTLVFISHKAALWTDSRYFIQADDQLKNSGIDLMKLNTPDCPSTIDWLCSNLDAGMKVGVDEWCVSENNYKALKTSLNEKGLVLKESGDLFENIWTERPTLPKSKIFEHELKYAGTSRNEKILKVISELKRSNSDIHIISSLDEIAWLFNLRGNDIEYNPVFIAWAVVSAKETILFIDTSKIEIDLKETLIKDGIQIKDYHSIKTYLLSLNETQSIFIDADKANHALFELIPRKCKIQSSISIPCKLKARKTEKEILNIKNAMKKDGIALIEFLYWLKTNIGKIEITEYTVAEKLTELRQKQLDFRGISFYPIIGYKEHGAIVHFHVTKTNALPIKNEGFLLFDSGGQYLDGTTDITRTIALSRLTKTQRTDFTLVLKGMISLTCATFPVNTRGCNLDILARKDLWDNGLNYGHGTGHGVGYFLNVHEGPMSIRQEYKDYPIEECMVLSNEPALYRDGLYGIRTENIIHCIKKESGVYGDFLGFETLTLCPIDTTAIEINLLNKQEINWINNYHKHVYDELQSFLTDELREYLKEITIPI